MEIKQFMGQVFDEAFALSDEKGEDYRIGSQDVHANFRNVGNSFDVEPHIVLGIYMKKHFDAIVNYMKTDGASESEPIRERIKDAINYLILGFTLIKYDGITEVDRFRNVRGVVAQTVLARRVMDVTDEFLEVAVPAVMATVNICIKTNDAESYEPAMRNLIKLLLYFLYLDEQS